MSTTMSFIRSETDIWIVGYYFAELFCILIIFGQIVGLCYNSSRLQALNHESWVSKQGATRNILISLFTTYLCSTIGIVVVISRIGNHLYDPFHCEYTYMISFMLFATAKLCNYYFFLQRAKLAQGLNKTLPDLAFKRIFPIIFALLYIFYIILIISFPIKGHQEVSPNTGRLLCIWTPPDIEHEIIFIISTLFDVFMTIFLLYLYGKPLCEIVQHSSMTLSSNTNEVKLRRCIMVNFVCSSISSIHTAVVALTWYNLSFMSWWSIMDYAVNCLCLFLMFASNRRLLLHCCCCHYKCVSGNTKYTMYTQQHTQQQQQHKTKELNVNNSPLRILHPSSASTDLPSIRTVSDFPQPRAVLEPEVSDPELAYENDKRNNRTQQASSIIPPTSTSRDSNIYKDAAERNGFISKNGINYFKYLDGDNRACWYYKSKLFWTWFLYYFCFCGNASLCKCFCCVCNHQICKQRMKKKQHVLRYMFGAAKKIQYIRYYQRLTYENTHLQSAAQSQSSITKKSLHTLSKPSIQAQRSLSGIHEVEVSDDSDRLQNDTNPNVARSTSNSVS